MEKHSFSTPFNNLLSGSHVAFKKMERPAYTEIEREINLENKKTLEEGISLLRKMRTSALEATKREDQQTFLQEAHTLSSAMAKTIIELTSQELSRPIEEDLLDRLKALKEQYRGQDAGSGYALPTQFSIQNILRATEDILIRIKEEAVSFTNPDHQLDFEEVKYVLREFFKGTNDLNEATIKAMFSPSTKTGGILSGGSVYTEIVKQCLERYAIPSLRINTFVVAVDKHANKAVFEYSDADKETTHVIIVDDMIHEGGTMITALRAAGEYFPQAIINSGVGEESKGEWEKRRQQKHLSRLEGLFQDFADLAMEGKNDEAMKLFEEAESYALENKVELQPGWYIRKDKIRKK